MVVLAALAVVASAVPAMQQPRTLLRAPMNKFIRPRPFYPIQAPAQRTLVLNRRLIQPVIQRVNMLRTIVYRQPVYIQAPQQRQSFVKTKNSQVVAPAIEAGQSQIVDMGTQVFEKAPIVQGGVSGVGAGHVQGGFVGAGAGVGVGKEFVGASGLGQGLGGQSFIGGGDIIDGGFISGGAGSLGGSLGGAGAGAGQFVSIDNLEGGLGQIALGGAGAALGGAGSRGLIGFGGDSIGDNGFSDGFGNFDSPGIGGTF